VWPDDEADMPRPDRLSRQGFRIRHWRQAGMSCWAISDLNDAELDEFVRLFRSRTQEPPG
jgi:anti-sigma factor RsiW